MKNSAMSFKKLVIITTTPEVYSIKRFKDVGSKYFKEMICFNPYLSLTQIHSAPLELSDSDLILHRITGARLDDHDLVLSDLINNNSQVINSLSALRLHRTKSTQLVHYHKCGVNIVPTLLIRNILDQNQLIKELEQFKTNEFILKFERGNQGIGVNYCSSIESLYSWIESLNALKLNTFMVQPFLKRNCEYRVYFCHNKIVGILERKSSTEDSFKVNYHQNGQAVLIKNPSEKLLSFSNKIIANSGCFYGSIDIIEGNDQELYLLEVNSVTGFEQFENVSQFDFVSHIYKELISLL